MSLLDELQEEVDKRSVMTKKRAQITRLRKQAKEGLDAQFWLETDNTEAIARLQGRLEAFDECLNLFSEGKDRGSGKEKPTWNNER